ncbi:trk system potassium uptake protein TrkH [Haloferula luteola]|uniref:Trk system potassium uptake protein TrkH n=1 Tax=Haloferula luteola TaxID=595692 RepID=A0A840VID3_9BACT|nr:TrkH family potassium uptake protein [Haloferula luteola]MBB5353600.1 trk system potassium uptake protein TrkH [Haloferula luteola]
MNFRILAKVLGYLLMLLAMAMAACGVFAKLDVVSGDHQAMLALFTSAGVTALAALILIVVGIGKIDRIPRREGVVIVGVAWILSAIFGALPFVLCPPHMDFCAGVFEAASGFTTTGSTVMSDIESWPRGLLLWRSVTQWLGGIGILVLFVAVLSYLGLGAKSLFRNESSFQSGEATTARIHDTSLILLRVYGGITVICILGLKLMGLTWYHALSHAFTAVSTGGFSPHAASVAYYGDWGNDWLIELWLSLFMLLCSLNFIVYVVILHKKWKRLREEDDARWFVGLCLGIALAIAIGLRVDPRYSTDFWSAFRDAWFIVVSIASTTGFGTADYELWPAWCKALLAILMLIGGCSGSTAGGLKVGRLIVFLKSSAHEIIRAYRPNQIFRLVVNGNPVDDSGRARTVSFVALYLFIVAGSAVVVGMLEAGQGIDLETCLGAVLATLSNIGPGFGDLGPTEHFGEMRDVTQLFLAGLMILGRLELFAILVLFVPGVWRRF